MLDLIDDIFLEEKPADGNIEPKKMLDFLRLSGGIGPNLLLAFMTLGSTTLINTQRWYMLSWANSFNEKDSTNLFNFFIYYGIMNFI